MNLFDNTLLLISQYVHLLCTTLLVGGTLFYEMVVPIAIADLKPEQQLAIFARARWVFRRIVWVSVVLLVATGVISTKAHWKTYSALERIPTYLPAENNSGNWQGPWPDDDGVPNGSPAATVPSTAPAVISAPVTSPATHPDDATIRPGPPAGYVTPAGTRLYVNQPNGDTTFAMRSGWWWAAHASCGLLALLIAVFLNTGPTPPNHPVQWMRLNLVILMIVIFLAAATNHVRNNSFTGAQENRARYQP